MPDQLEASSLRDRCLPALAKANKVRCARARIKAKLASRELYLDDVLEPRQPPACLASATILEVLCSARGFGEVKARRALRRLNIPAHRKVGRMPQCERKELIEFLIRENGQAFYGSAAVGEYLC